MSLEDRDWYRAEMARRQRWPRQQRERQRTLAIVAVLITIAASLIVAFDGIRLDLIGDWLRGHRYEMAILSCIVVLWLVQRHYQLRRSAMLRLVCGAGILVSLVMMAGHESGLLPLHRDTQPNRLVCASPGCISIDGFQPRR
jgi:hypothetical protein